MTIRTILVRTTATAALLAVAAAPALAHPGEGPAGVVHDLLHGFLLGTGHGLRPVGPLLTLLGAAVLVGAFRAGRPERWARLRAVGGTAVLAGLALTLA